MRLLLEQLLLLRLLLEVKVLKHGRLLSRGNVRNVMIVDRRVLLRNE